MPPKPSFRNALIFAAGIASVAARPARLVARSSGAADINYSSAYVAPASSAPASYAAPASTPTSYVAPAGSAPAYSAPPAGSALASYAAPTSSAPASYVAPTISLPGSVAPASTLGSYSALPSLSNGPGIVVGSSSPAASPTTTTEAPAPVATWHIDLEVGTSAFNIGDADPTTFEGLWNNACGADGCDGGSPQTFTFNGIGGGVETKLTGQFVMSGNIDNNQVWTTDLLDAINGALQGSKQCSTQTAESCPLKRDPETPGVASDCSDIQITQCTMANWIQATMYDDTSSQKAQITMSASSQSADFDCGTVLGAMNGLATGLDLAPPVVAATVFAQVVCAAASGS